jgi:hypothetical protein
MISTPTNTITRFTSDGVFDRVIRDYNDNGSFPGDNPVSIKDYDTNNILVLVENFVTPTMRRIEKVAKDGSSYSNFLINTTAFSPATSIVKDFAYASDGGYLVAKGSASPNTAIEKFTSSKARILSGANPYVSNPAGTCATVTTYFTRVIAGPSGTIIATHAAASPNNKTVLISANGYSTAADCLAVQSGLTVNHYPTALLYHSSGKLFIAYGNTTGPVHAIYSYTVTSNSISNETLVWSNVNVTQGISAMSEMSDGTILVASAASTFNTIEKFTYASNTFTRVGTTSFIGPSAYTRSVSSIISP